MKRINRKEAALAIQDKEPFKSHTGSFWAEWVDEFNYVISSYRTPIAWYDASSDKWEITAHSYSVTTARHKGIVRRAITGRVSA